MCYIISMFTSYTLLVFAAGFISSDCHPIDPKVVLPVADGFGIVVLGTAFLIVSVITLIACSCCKRRDGFKSEEEVEYEKEFQNESGLSCREVGFSNALASSELAIFPPPGSGGASGAPSYRGSSPSSPLNGEVAPLSRPAAFSAVIPSVSDWFTDPNANFPRQQLFYQKEIGKGWFGKVVKGEARGTKVVVRILREDATPEEKSYFLHEAKPFRDLRHKNVTRLFGRCLDNDPFLLLFEFSTNGDLKSFLVTNSGSRHAITEQKISLKLMLDVTEGLKFMNENGFIHTDLAARNCLVASDLTVKIGDYGTSIDKYKNEYYIVGDMAVPIRWCAPETLTITSTTIETKQVTEAGNVWSLAVLLWEIAEFGKLPYAELSDEEVIYQVLSSDGRTRLPEPNCPFGQYMHHIMTTCWKVEDQRASIDEVLSMLVYLKSNPFQDSDFETRWKALKPNTVPVVDNHTPIHSPRHTLLAQRPRLPAKMEFDSGVDLDIKPSDESCRTSTPNTISPQLSVASEDVFQPLKHKSPSLTNLKGSLEDVGQFDSWLMGVEQKTDEDRTFVRSVSEAIKNLDETLAQEKTSSSSADSSMDGTRKPLLDFKLGPIERERKGDSSSSDTEEETWRHRIERGEFTEKVKEKSKSVTDLMVLTHIDSEGSESDSLPSLTRQYSLKKSVAKGVSFTGVGFGSEGNIRNAVLSEELQEKLKQLTLWKTDDQSFLVKGASETIFSIRIPTVFKKRDIKLVKSSNLKDRETKSLLPNLNSVSENVNNVSVINEDIKIVNSNHKNTEKNEIKSNLERAHPEGDVQSVSSQSVESSVPKIIITESEVPKDLDEPETLVNTQCIVDVKPRKFVFVCREEDEKTENEISHPVQVESTEVKDGPSTAVILGPSDEHTLDYFKGLKTTFMPVQDVCTGFVELNDVEVNVDEDSDVSQNDISEEDSSNFTKNKIKDYTLPDVVPEVFNSNFVSYSELENNNINSLIHKTIEQTIESRLLLDSELSERVTDESNLVTSSVKDISEDNFEDDVPLIHDDKGERHHFQSDGTLNSNDSFSTDSPVACGNILNSCSSDTESSSSSEEQLVEAPYPFNQPLLSDHQLKSKSLDSFLNSQSDLDQLNILNGGGFYENNSRKQFVPVFSMTESISENTFNDPVFDPFYSLDSGHSSDRCMEQDKQMIDLKSRLEDVVKSGSDFQLKNSEEEYGGKLLTPDDERSSDSGFRDKGSLSESVEDTCDEKYNLEDIDAELEDFTLKSMKDDYRYYEQLKNETDPDISPWFLPIRPEATTCPKETKDNGWVSQSTENDEAYSLTIDADFAAAIRNELKDKLPSSQPTEKSDEENSPESEEQELNTDSTAQFVYPSQLSPILEEQESNQSSLHLNEASPILVLPPPESHSDDLITESQDTRNAVIIEDLENDNITVFSENRLPLDEDVLIVNTETNEATLIESPKPQAHLAFMLPLDEASGNDYSPQNRPDHFILSPDNGPLTPNSISTGTHSSPDHGNMSGFFLSPCSIRSDLFDSGPPSLPFDLGQSLEEVEELPVYSAPNEGNLTETTENVETEDNKIKDEKLITQDFLKMELMNYDYVRKEVDADKLLNQPIARFDSQKESEQLLNGESPLPNGESSACIQSSDKQWLKDLFVNGEPTQETKSKASSNGNLNNKDWPTVDELIVGKPEKSLKPNINSTLALLSPDLSSTDSKSLSILSSSFSSTPTSEDSRTVLDAFEYDDKMPSKPKSLSLSAEKQGTSLKNGTAPMPSPEDAEKGWRPTICQLMELTEAAADGEEMTTSFIEPDENGIYTPDWESDISEQSSSSSGEFVWKEGDKEDLIKCVSSDANSLLDEMGPIMERIEEEEEDRSSTSGSETSSSSSGSVDFVPSTWNALAVPVKSVLRSPQSQNESSGEVGKKKQVVFKKEKYQCVYEYPREESDEEEELEEPLPTTWQTPSQPHFDYSIFADWEFADGETPTPVDSADSEIEVAKKPNKEKEYDFYRLDYNLTPNGGEKWSETVPEDDSEFSPLASDLTPVRLGDLRHTKATLRLELPAIRPDQGEASILDSGLAASTNIFSNLAHSSFCLRHEMGEN